jgi:hypothetical protein
MTQQAQERDPDNVLTVEAIAKLSEEAGKPAAALMNVVALPRGGLEQHALLSGERPIHCECRG